MNKRISLCFAILLATLSPTTSQARYLNPNTGRFQTMDSYEGNNQDPQSLHKYHYCHDNPVNAVDPSGHYGMLEMWVLDSVRTYYWASASPSAIAIGTGTAGPDVTRAIKRTLLDVEAKFYTWTRNQKIDAGLKMRDFWGSVGSLATGGGAKAWDILGLYGASQDDPYLITEKNHYPTGRGAGAKTVTFNGKSYYAGAVNYAMWGKMNK